MVVPLTTLQVDRLSRRNRERTERNRTATKRAMLPAAVLSCLVIASFRASGWMLDAYDVRGGKRNDGGGGVAVGGDDDGGRSDGFDFGFGGGGGFGEDDGENGAASPPLTKWSTGWESRVDETRRTARTAEERYERRRDARDRLLDVTDDGALDDPGSPQGMAFHWIVFEDERRVDPDDPHLVQRYALATLWFATNDDAYAAEGGGHAGNSDDDGRDGGVRRRKKGEGKWKRRLNFLSPLHECDWRGEGGIRRCDSDGYVADVSLWNGLRGTIPSEIGSLTKLTVLYLARNELRGTIPATIGRLTDLEYLGLQHNKLTGTVPSVHFGGLLRLTNAYFEKNDLTGTIRRVDPLCQLMVDAKPPINGTYLGGKLIKVTADCSELVSWKGPEVTCGCCTRCYRA